MAKETKGSAKLTPLISSPSITQGQIYFDDNLNKMIISEDGSTRLVLTEQLDMFADITEVLNITAQTGGANASFSTLGTSSVNKVEIENIGSVDAYIDLDTSASLTTGYKLAAGKALTLTNTNISSFSAITSSGTSTIRITGFGKSGNAGMLSIKELNQLAVTSASSALTFTTLTTSTIRNLIVYNAGVSDCYFNFGATATTNNTYIKAGGYKMFNNISKIQFAAICSGSNTTTLCFMGLGA